MNNSQTNNESSPFSLIIKSESEKWCEEDLNIRISNIRLHMNGRVTGEHWEVMCILNSDNQKGLRISRNNASDTIHLNAELNHTKWNEIVFFKAKDNLTVGEVRKAAESLHKDFPSYDFADCQMFAKYLLRKIVHPDEMSKDLIAVYEAEESFM